MEKRQLVKYNPSYHDMQTWNTYYEEITSDEMTSISLYHGVSECERLSRKNACVFYSLTKKFVCDKVLDNVFRIQVSVIKTRELEKEYYLSFKTA
jgi:hypothetical protein